MWYDNFIKNLQNFIGQFSSGNFLWHNFINDTVVALFLTIAFSISAIAVLLLNGFLCGEVKIGRALKRTKRYFLKNDILKKENSAIFCKYCLNNLSKKARVLCEQYAVNPTYLNQQSLQKCLKNISHSSCVAGYIFYILFFTAMFLFAIATSFVESIWFSASTYSLAVSIVYGVILLIVVSAQVYYIGNKYDCVEVDLLQEIVSRVVKEKSAKVIKTTPQPKLQKTYNDIDGVDELRRIVYGLIDSGASKQLLSMVKDSLICVAKTKYNSHVDELRINNIVEKIDNYIA